MSLSSTAQYYVTIDSQFRDQQKYPLDSDFGVSFSTKDPTLNYPQGLPVDKNEPFPRVSIDRNFENIGIQVKGGKITEYVVDSITGDIIFSGVTYTPTDNTAKDFLITYNDNILFSLLASIYHTSPFICRVSSNYIPKWLIMIKQKPTKTNTTLDSTFKLISNSSLYFMFDYTMCSGLNENLRIKDLIYFERYTYSSFNTLSNTNIYTVKTLNYSFENYYTNYLYNIQESNAVVGVFAFDINGNPLQLNGHPWGYHQFAMNTYYSGQIFSMLPSNSNGRNVITVDKGDNLYAGINVNPFNIELQTNNIHTITPYYKFDLTTFRKPIFYSIHTDQNIESAGLGSISLNPTQTDNVLVYYIGCSSNDAGQNVGANKIGLLKVNITSPYFQTVDKGLEVDILNSYPLCVGSFIDKNTVRPLTLVGNDINDQYNYYGYYTGNIFNITDYQYYQIPSPSTQGNGVMTLDAQFGYTGTMNSVCSLSINSYKQYISFITTAGLYRFNLYSFCYTYTGPGNSSLDLIQAIELSPGLNYDYVSLDCKVANWMEGATPYLAYILRGDADNGLYNTIFISTIPSSTTTTLNIKKGMITDFQAFTIGTKVFLLVVSDNVTYVFKRDYSVSSSWTTITIPNNAHYVVPKVKSNRVYLVGSNISLNTSNVYVIPYENTSYYYQVGPDYRFASSENAVVSVTDNNIVSLGRTNVEDTYVSTFNYPRGFTFQDKIVDSQHVYYNNSYVATLPTEFLTQRRVVNIKTLTINEYTYLFTLRYEDGVNTNIDIFYMDGFNPIYITNYQFTRTPGDPTNPEFRVYYLPNGTNDIDGNPYGQDTSFDNIGNIIIVTTPSKQHITDGVNIVSFSLNDYNGVYYLEFNREDTIDAGVPVHNSWIYNYGGVYYLVNNIMETTTPTPSTFYTYSIDYKYRYSLLNSHSFSEYILAGEVYYNYTDPNTRENKPSLICYHTTSPSDGYWSVVSLIDGVILQSGLLPSPAQGWGQNVFVSLDRNKRTNNYGIASISWAYYTYLINIQDNGTITLSNEVMGFNYTQSQTVSVVWNPVINRLLVTGFAYILGFNTTALVYDVTNAGTSNDIITLSSQINLKNVIEYNDYISTDSPYTMFSSLCNQNVILFTSSSAFKVVGPSIGGSTPASFPTIVTYDLSNPLFANLYQIPTKVTNNINVYGNGNALLLKLQNDGQTLWNISLGDSTTSFESQYVNINSISLDSTELNLYSSVNWKTKLSVIDTTTSQNITNPFNSYNSQNSAFLKVRGDIGTSTFLVPIVGGNDTVPIGCNSISTSAFSLGLSAKSSITYIYKLQTAGTLTNPSVIQNVVNTLSLENSHIISIDTSGNLLWSSSIQSTDPATSIPAYYLYTYGGDTFLVSKANNNCYIVDSSKTKKQSVIQFPETSLQDYILITRVDSNGLYKESDTIEIPSTMNINPQFLFSNGNTFSLSTTTYERNLNFADLWIRNKDGTIGSIEPLPEENLYYVKTVYSTPGVYIYNSPTGCIGSVVKLWGAGGDAGRFYLHAGPSVTVGGEGGGGSFSKTFIDPSYNKFAIKVGSASLGGQTLGPLIDAINNSGNTGTGFGGDGGESSWVAVDAFNSTGPIEGGFTFYAISAGGGGGGYDSLHLGGPGGNNPSVVSGNIGNYGQNGIGGTPNPSYEINSKGVNCPLTIQNTYPFFYTLTGSFGKGGTGSEGCGAGGQGWGGGAGGNVTVSGPMNEYNGGAGGGIYGDLTLTSSNYLAANNTDSDYVSGVGEGGNGSHLIGGNGYVVVYSFYYSSTGFTYGEAPAFTGINPTYIDGTIINYKYNPSYTDVNGTVYSKITCYTSSGSTGTAFIPYHTTGPFTFSTGSTGTDLIGKYIYIKGDPSDTILNNNFSIRGSYYDTVNNQYIITLNSKIDTSQIIRSFQQINDSYLSNYFYSSNITQSLTTAILPYGGPTGSVISVPNTVTLLSNTTYYIITPVNKVTKITNISLVGSYYYLTVDNVSNLLGNTYITIVPFNRSALYTLQFYPGSLSVPQYFKVTLQRLTLPNRRIRNSPYSGVRELSDFPYIFLELYNASDSELFDNQIVNTFYTNDPNRTLKAIFTVPITSAGGQSNYLFLSSAGTPKIKFTPGYYNIRMRLVDTYGNLIEFDNTPYKTSDSAFTGGVVDPRLMNVIADLTFTPV